MGVGLSAADRAHLVEYRTEGRLEEYGAVMIARYAADGLVPGGCAWMSEYVWGLLGYDEAGGCYVTAGGHAAHLWNVLPDGRILDTTADQFAAPAYGERDIPADGVRIVAGDDRRYDASCDGEDRPGVKHIG